MQQYIAVRQTNVIKTLHPIEGKETETYYAAEPYDEQEGFPVSVTKDITLAFKFTDRSQAEAAVNSMGRGAYVKFL